MAKNNPDMDKVLAYRSLLAVEDHLNEICAKAGDQNKRNIANEMYGVITILRDEVMPEEKDSDWHCVVKHLCTAYEACCEVKKNDSGYAWISRSLYDVLVLALEQLWGRKIETCERCHDNKEEDGRVQDESRTSTSDPIEY